jgi:CRISPR/Cas system CSM-associated protein Csm3 (group 7 of RAMP superfamily)
MSNQRLNRKHRVIIKRIIIKGVLILDTPTCLGNGEADGPTDLMLLRDSITSKALLTGASLAGALRNYLHEYQFGYSQDEKIDSLSTSLFGAMRKDDDGEQSPLIIHDSISSNIPTVELRDAVKIDIKTGTADEEKSAKYDLELLAAGTEFPLNFELLIEEKQDQNELLQGLKIILQGLENSDINLGIKKSRGFGSCHVDKWQVWQFNLKDSQQRLAWLAFDRDDWQNNYNRDDVLTEGKIGNIFSNINTKDNRQFLHIKATFKLMSSLLIRSGKFSTDTSPDVVHLSNSKNEYILPGTSFTGVLRHRAEKIVNTVGIPKSFIDDIFGIVEENKSDATKSSRLIVKETVIEKSKPLVQNRIAIDRFTGGTLHGALFDEQPIYGGDKTVITLDLFLRQVNDANQNNAEIGLLLLLIKDLWTSDLAIGGESSIGRGKLQGIKAEITICTPDKGNEHWEIIQQQEQLQISEPNVLENFVSEFNKLFNGVLV